MMEARKLSCIRNRGGDGSAVCSKQGIYTLTCLSLAGSDGHISSCTNGERPGASNVRLMTPSSAGEKDLSVVTTSLGLSLSRS